MDYGFIYFIGNERKVYEYIVRHFLACLSKDAEGLETTVEIDINNEKVNWTIWLLNYAWRFFFFEKRSWSVIA